MVCWVSINTPIVIQFTDSVAKLYGWIKKENHFAALKFIAFYFWIMDDAKQEFRSERWRDNFVGNLFLSRASHRFPPEHFLPLLSVVMLIFNLNFSLVDILFLFFFLRCTFFRYYPFVVVEALDEVHRGTCRASGMVNLQIRTIVT